jgi:hypothetical protein
MTAHTVRLKRPAKGALNGHMARVAASFGKVEFDQLRRFAAERRIPVAKVIRDAVLDYLQQQRMSGP